MDDRYASIARHGQAEWQVDEATTTPSTEYCRILDRICGSVSSVRLTMSGRASARSPWELVKNFKEQGIMKIVQHQANELVLPAFSDEASIRL